jgi:ParB-like chromosome segregation protein Spo0J
MKKKLSLLKPHPSNKVLYGDTEPDQVKDLAENISTYGQITPVVINKSNLILSGHRRIAALKLLGRTFAECTIQDISSASEAGLVRSPVLHPVSRLRILVLAALWILHRVAPGRGRVTIL